MVQVPGSSAVWTSSFKAVKRVPSCRVTAFSIGSCRPAVWMASPTRQECNIITIPWQRCISSLVPSLSALIQRSISVKRLLTRTWFVGWCLAFLFGNQPVNFIKHSVNLRQDQQLGRESKMMMMMVMMMDTLRKQILSHWCHSKSEASACKTLTAPVVVVFMLTMAKWDCFSTSTVWPYRKESGQWHVNFDPGTRRHVQHIIAGCKNVYVQ